MKAQVLINGIRYVPVAVPPSSKLKLPALLKKVRKSVGMTLDHAAQQIGCSKSHLWTLEAGQCEPSLRLAGAIAHTYGITVNSMYDALEKDHG